MVSVPSDIIIHHIAPAVSKVDAIMEQVGRSEVHLAYRLVIPLKHSRLGTAAAIASETPARMREPKRSCLVGGPGRRHAPGHRLGIIVDSP